MHSHIGPPSAFTELERKLFVTTCRFEQETDAEEKALLGADVRELEKQVEIVAAEAEKTENPGSVSRNR